MPHIPTSEIKQPDLHADTLGFTFIYQGHFLRGIFPESEALAKGYFESGFIDEVTSKGLFPKTWISEFENERFCMILEHEMISPVLYATEWNFLMLKDAALMVLEIAQIGWKYGYNMIDCHKLNVLFKNNHPIYIDLGSFVPKKEGCTGWNPYVSFLQSYYYILDIWKDGASQIAKRVMSPGVMINIEDYFLYKHPLFRHFRFLFLLRKNCLSRFSVLAISEMEFIKKKRSSFFAKKMVNRLKPFDCQKFERIKKRVSKIKVKELSPKCSFDFEYANNVVERLKVIGFPRTITFIDNPILELYETICNQIEVDKIVSVQQHEPQSEREYHYLKKIDLPVCSTYFQLMNGGFLIRGKFPENRLASDAVVLTSFNPGTSVLDMHNAMVLLKNYALFSKSVTMFIFFQNHSKSFVEKVKSKYEVLKEWDENGGGLYIKIGKNEIVSCQQKTPIK